MREVRTELLTRDMTKEGSDNFTYRGGPGARQLWKRGGVCEGHLDADESQQEPKARMEGVGSGGGEKGPQAVDGGTSLVPREWHSPK